MKKKKRGQGKGLGKALLKGFYRTRRRQPAPEKKARRKKTPPRLYLSRLTRASVLDRTETARGKASRFALELEASEGESKGQKKLRKSKTDQTDLKTSDQQEELLESVSEPSDEVQHTAVTDEKLAKADRSETLPIAVTEGEGSSVTAQLRVETEPKTESRDSGKLLTSDLLRPGDELRKSIEGFLLDQRSPHTRKAYGKDLKRFVLYLHGRKHQHGIEGITRTILIAYKEYLLNEKLEHTTVDRHIATLRSFFGWLVDDGIIEKNPADGVRFLNPKRLSTTRGFSDEEVRKVLMIPDLHTRTGSQHYAILMVLFYCGLRRSEICELRTKNFDVERNQHIMKLRGKGNKERLIVLIPPVWHALKHYFLISARSMTVDDYLFKPMRNNRTGVLKKALDPSMIFYIVTRYAKLAGIPSRVSPHSCRATAISNARDHNVPDRAIQEFAGWSSPDMITRYDKRKTSVEDSAAHSISYGAESRRLPEASASLSLTSPASSTADSESTTAVPELPVELKQ